MERYIDADLVVKEAFEIHTQEYGNIEVVAVDIIHEAPTAPVKEVVYGEWIDITPTTEEHFYGFKYSMCSICGNEIDVLLKDNAPKYCEECGADMRGVE